MPFPDPKNAVITHDDEHSHPHWLRLKPDSWFLRRVTPHRKESLHAVVSLGYHSLIEKVAGGRIQISNEASLQLHFSSLLRHIGILYEHSPDDLFSIELEKPLVLKNPTVKRGSTSARADILMILGGTDDFAICAIELKYFKKRNHREPNNRYDVFADIANLEEYRQLGIDRAYLLIATDHCHYVSQEEYSPDTGDFDFRNGTRYERGKELVYRTARPYGPPIILDGNYTFTWETLSQRYIWGGEQYSMLLPINPDG